VQDFFSSVDHQTAQGTDVRIWKLHSLPLVQVLVVRILAFRKQLRTHQDSRDVEMAQPLDPTLFYSVDQRYNETVRSLVEADAHEGLTADELHTFRSNYGSAAFLCHIQGCSKSRIGYRTADELRGHLRRYHQKMLKCYWAGCTYNDIGFVSAKTLRDHLNRFHGEGGNRQVPRSLRRKRAGPQTDKEPADANSKEQQQQQQQQKESTTPAAQVGRLPTLSQLMGPHSPVEEQQWPQPQTSPPPSVTAQQSQVSARMMTNNRDMPQQNGIVAPSAGKETPPLRGQEHQAVHAITDISNKLAQSTHHLLRSPPQTPAQAHQYLMNHVIETILNSDLAPGVRQGLRNLPSRERLRIMNQAVDGFKARQRIRMPKANAGRRITLLPDDQHLRQSVLTILGDIIYARIDHDHDLSFAWQSRYTKAQRASNALSV